MRINTIADQDQQREPESKKETKIFIFDVCRLILVHGVHRKNSFLDKVPGFLHILTYVKGVDSNYFYVSFKTGYRLDKPIYPG